MTPFTTSFSVPSPPTATIVSRPSEVPRHARSIAWPRRSVTSKSTSPRTRSTAAAKCASDRPPASLPLEGLTMRSGRVPLMGASIAVVPGVPAGRPEPRRRPSGGPSRRHPALLNGCGRSRLVSLTSTLDKGSLGAPHRTGKLRTAHPPPQQVPGGGAAVGALLRHPGDALHRARGTTRGPAPGGPVQGRRRRPGVGHRRDTGGVRARQAGPALAARSTPASTASAATSCRRPWPASSSSR